MRRFLWIVPLALPAALGRYFLLEGNRVWETHIDLETFES